jgi:CheY-like chemotaxis protein
MDFDAVKRAGTEFSSKLKILVVDDDVLSQRLIQLLLAREGYIVDTASSGLEALDRIKLQKYDIVFMDLQMPGMDGIESTHQIRQWENGKQHTFIVALTQLPSGGRTGLFKPNRQLYLQAVELEHIQPVEYIIRVGLILGK